MVKMCTSQEDFTSEVSKSCLTVVDFTASWCGPCQMIGPKFILASEKYTTVNFIKVDVDECEDVAGACGISAMPTFQFYKDGKKVDDFCGADEGQLIQRIEKNM
jgi:thioredoxin